MKVPSNEIFISVKSQISVKVTNHAVCESETPCSTDITVPQLIITLRKPAELLPTGLTALRALRVLNETSTRGIMLLNTAPQ